MQDMPDYHQRAELNPTLNELLLPTASHSSPPPGRERPTLEIKSLESSLAIIPANIEILEYVESLRLMMLAAEDTDRPLNHDEPWPGYLALEKIGDVVEILWAIGSYQRAFNLSFQLLTAILLSDTSKFDFVPAISKMSCSASTTEQLQLLVRTMKYLLRVPGCNNGRTKCALHIQLANGFRKLAQPAESAKYCLHAREILEAKPDGCNFDGRTFASLICECEKTVSECDDVYLAKQTMDFDRDSPNWYTRKTTNDERLLAVFKYCTGLILEERLCAAAALPAALEAVCNQYVDFPTTARHASIVVFGHIWKIFHSGPLNIDDAVEDLRYEMGINRPETFATMALVLMNLGSPFFAHHQTVGRSYHLPPWTTQRTHDLLLFIYQAAQALVSKDRTPSDFTQMFLSAHATTVLNQVPKDGRTTKYVGPFLEGDLNLPSSLHNFIHQALSDDVLPPT